MGIENDLFGRVMELFQQRVFYLQQSQILYCNGIPKYHIGKRKYMNWKVVAIVLIVLEIVRIPFVVSPQKAKENLKAWMNCFAKK